jgi:WD40 repeat protein
MPKFGSYSINSVCFSTDGRYFLSGSSDSTICLCELFSGKVLWVFEGHTGPVTKVSFSSDGKVALSVSEDSTMRLWDIQTGECIRVFGSETKPTQRYPKLKPGIPTSAELSLDGRYLISGNKYGTIRVWELEWDYDFPEPVDWDEGAHPYLFNFLTLHPPIHKRLRSIPLLQTWTEEDFQDLLTQLSYCGFGWLRPEGIKRQLKKMAKEW